MIWGTWLWSKCVTYSILVTQAANTWIYYSFSPFLVPIIDLIAQSHWTFRYNRYIFSPDDFHVHECACDCSCIGLGRNIVHICCNNLSIWRDLIWQMMLILLQTFYAWNNSEEPQAWSHCREVYIRIQRCKICDNIFCWKEPWRTTIEKSIFRTPNCKPCNKELVLRGALKNHLLGPL